VPKPVNSLISVIAVAASLCALTQPARAVETIPFTDAGGLIHVQGSVDSQPPVPMLVDLGAGVDVLSSDLGRRYVVVRGKYVSLRLTGERVDLPIGTVNSLAIGGVTIDAPHVGIWNGLGTSGVEGLISATAFRNIATTFDFRNDQIILEDAQTFPERIRPETRLPLILQDDLGIALGIFARFDFGGGRTGLCEIDTGAPGITIDKTFAASAGLDPSGAAKATIGSIALVGAPQSVIEQPTATFADIIYDCIVGNTFWTNRTFTLDLPNRFMYIST
jgi:hypothetical protein